MTCRHRQAEPVILSTGEQVACVCIECFDPLPENYIRGQRTKAEIAAYCRHEDRLSVRSMGDPSDTEICVECSARGVFWAIYGQSDLTRPISAVPYFSSHAKAMEAAKRHLDYGYENVELRPASPTYGPRLNPA